MSEVTTKTFEEVINPYGSSLITDLNEYSFSNREVIEFMRFVREKTLIECAKKATAGMNFNFTGNVPYVNESSILSLDKNHIEI